MDLSRRELFFFAPVLSLAACGGGDAATVDAPPANCLANGTRAIIAYNHGHTLDVPAADIAAGTQTTYDITGSADHSHSVSVSAAQMATLAGNAGIQVMSTASAGHAHTIDVRCR